MGRWTRRRQRERWSYDRQLIEAVLKKTGGNISEASRLVGLSRNGLKNKIRQYGL